MSVGGGGTTNKKAENNQDKVEDVHCLVKFRPCKDWRGEYGFDWVREGEKDFYKERIGDSVSDYDDGVSARDLVKADRGEEGYQAWEDEVLEPLKKGRKREKENYVRNEMLCMQGEERARYEEDLRLWEAETDEAKKDAMLDDLANRKLNADFFYKEGIIEKPWFLDEEKMAEIDDIVLDVYAKCEIDEQRAAGTDNPYKWQKDNKWRMDESKADMDKGMPPFEYFYDAADVTKVTYRIRHASPIWTYEVHTKNQANQSDEAKKADKLFDDDGEDFRHLDHFVQLQGGKCSMLKDDDEGGSSFTVPYYRLKDEGATLSCPMNKKYELWKKKSSKSGYSFSQDIRVTGILNMAVRGKLDGGLYCFSRKDENSLHDVDHYEELRPLISSNHVELEKDDRIYDLRCCKVGGVKYVLANIFESVTPFQKKKKYELFYEDGVLKEVGGKAYKRLEAKAKKAVDEYRKSIEADMNKYAEMDVVDLLKEVKAGNIDNVVLTVCCPTDVMKYSVSENNGLKKEKDCSKLGHLTIKSWQEAYEDTFSPFPVRNFYEEGKNGELEKCLVPVLSISDADIKRKRFIFNSSTDAPKKEDEESHKYKLQMGFKGKAKKIGFKVVDSMDNDAPNVISVTPDSIENPDEKEPYEITVEYKGDPNLGPWPKDWMVLAKNMDGDIEKETVGKLRVRVNPSLWLTMLFIKVIVLEKDKRGKWNPKPFSQKLLDCMKDQEDAMRNTLAQVGIELILLKKEISIKKSEIQALYDRNTGQWDFCNRSDEVDKIFFKAFFEQHKSFSPYYKWCYYTFFFDTDDKCFKDNISAYSSIYESKSYPSIKFPRTIASGDVGINRTCAFVFSHEVLHRLGNPHTFQLHNNEFTFPFCFHIASSSNIMDYYTLRYSLHQYQWSNIRAEARSKIEENIRMERHERVEARTKKMNQKKAKNVVGNNKK